AMVLEIKNYINGQFVSPISGDYIDSISPATGVLNAKVPCSDKHDVDEAVSSAKRAFSSWSESSTKERADVMNRIADILESRLTEFARLESEDQAMLLATKIDIPRAVYNFRFFALSILNGTEECTHLTGASQHLNYVHRMPVGVAGLISPWNLPLYLLTWKIAPAIAFGNTCVAKPSELTSVTAWKLCEVFTAAKLPPGVVNIVFGYGTEVGEELVRHPDVSVVSFTGSTMVGQRISQVVAPYCKAVSLELGGKNAALVFGDADVNESVECCVRSSFANQGEVCLCTSRIYVQSNLYEEFVAKFVERTKLLRVGDPEDNSTDLGALVSKQHWEKVRKYIDIAISDGGTIKCGYGVEPLELPHKLKGGFFFPPTVITGVDDMSSCVQDEIFGPVVCIMPFDTEQEAIKRANNVKYGLCATVWTTHLERAHRVSKKLEAGTVWVNCWMVRDLRMPFGGMKHSGLGRESAKDSLEFFTEAKTICIKY
uniref:Aldehyde dehydrogenase domain-containing protein n=1 Tax=Ciona savignyi TaxID=51511 RepID=H2ZDC9_CIOSA